MTEQGCAQREEQAKKEVPLTAEEAEQKSMPDKLGILPDIFREQGIQSRVSSVDEENIKLSKFFALPSTKLLGATVASESKKNQRPSMENQLHNVEAAHEQVSLISKIKKLQHKYRDVVIDLEIINRIGKQKIERQNILMKELNMASKRVKHLVKKKEGSAVLKTVSTAVPVRRSTQDVMAMSPMPPNQTVDKRVADLREVIYSKHSHTYLPQTALSNPQMQPSIVQDVKCNPNWTQQVTQYHRLPPLPSQQCNYPQTWSTIPAHLAQNRLPCIATGCTQHHDQTRVTGAPQKKRSKRSPKKSHVGKR